MVFNSHKKQTADRDEFGDPDRSAAEITPALQQDAKKGYVNMFEKARPAAANGGRDADALGQSALNYSNFNPDSPTLSNPALRQQHCENVAEIYEQMAREAWVEGRDRDAKRYERQCYLYWRIAASAGSMKIKLEAMGVEL
jgi:hypothetical protein